MFVRVPTGLRRHVQMPCLMLRCCHTSFCKHLVRVEGVRILQLWRLVICSEEVSNPGANSTNSKIPSDRVLDRVYCFQAALCRNAVYWGSAFPS